MFSPRRGFKKCLELNRGGRGGWTRTALVALPAGLGGAFLLLVFLKVRSLTGFRPVAPDEFRWGVFAASLVVGAVTGVLAHFLFGAGAGPIVGRLGRRVSGRDLRLIWGVAAVPVAAGFALLVTLDLLIAGREAYAEVSGDTLVTGWTAGSLAVAVAVAVWSIYLFAHGLSVAAGIRVRQSIMVMMLAGVGVLVAAPAALLLVIGVVTLVGLLVDVFQAVSK